MAVDQDLPEYVACTFKTGACRFIIFDGSMVKILPSLHNRSLVRSCGIIESEGINAGDGERIKACTFQSYYGIVDNLEG
jgi:hypothetical protein